MATLQEVTTPRDGVLTVSPTWVQGRGAFGGLTIAAAIRAIEAEVADPRRHIRAVTAELPAPTLPGTAKFEVEILRAGNSLTVARAALRQGDEVTTHAVATLAAAREVADAPAYQELTPPDLPDWKHVPALPAVGPGPQFAQYFEYRVVEGIPFTRGSGSVTSGWIRPRDPGPARDAAYVAAVIDAWYPALMQRLAQPRPLATIAFTLELLGSFDGLPADAPLAYRGTVPVSDDGYFLETRELWGIDGRLIARNHQTFAIIR